MEVNPSAHRRQSEGVGSVDYFVAILDTRPLMLHFSPYNPVDATKPVLVPRLLTPLGAFVKVTILDQDGATVWETSQPKLGLKLHPERRESYLELEPGYSHGVVFRLEGIEVPAGPCEMQVCYSNGLYTGPREQPVGELAYNATVPFVCD